MNGVKLYFHYLSLHLRERMEYKKSLLLQLFGQFLVSFSLFLSIYFLFRRFHSVAGFSFSQVLLSFSVVMMAFSLSEVFFRGFDLFPQMLGNGEFDRILVRPRNTVFLVICSKFQLDRLSRVLQGVITLVYAIPRCGVDWTPEKAGVLALMILCGTVVFGCLFVCGAAVAFFTIEGLEFINIFTDGAREFGAYPMAVYGKAILLFTTFIIPIACFQYWPMLWLMGRSENLLYALCPLLSLLFILPSFLLWKLGMRKYQSTGS